MIQYVLLLFLLKLHSAFATRVMRFELRPTAALLEERRRRQRYLLEGNVTAIPEDWFHPYSNAIYATMHSSNHSSALETNSTSLRYQHQHPAEIDFHKHRHLSRYERHLRSTFNLNLQPDWNGTYDYNKNNNRSDIYFNSSLLRKLQQFNKFQSAPLSQGYGTHYVHLWIGSPTPQRQTVIVDTGSRFTAFPCQGCQKCGEKHHTDAHFNPNLSTSFRALTCPHECFESADCGDNNNKQEERHCHFTQAYTEGSSWKAYQVVDLLYCGGTDVLHAASHLDTKYSIPFMFGCLQQESGLFVTQLADGIMGMSAQETNLAKQLHYHGKIEYNMFALCFRKELGSSKRGVTAGTMTLGGVASTLDTSPMVYARNTKPTGWYTVHVNNIYIAKRGGRKFLFDTNDAPGLQDIIRVPIDTSVVNSGKGVIVDSGTTDTYLNTKIAPIFGKMWKQVTGMEYKHAPVSLTRDQLQKLPTILVQCQAAASPFEEYPKPVLGHVGYLDPQNSMDVLLAIPATSYMEYLPTIKMYASRLYFTETAGGVLGANAMVQKNVLFDWHHNRIGFAHSSCAYDLIDKEKEAGKDSNLSPETETFEDDCKLGKPILTRPCVESVDVSICKASDNPNNVDIMGIEVWTRLVRSPGQVDSCYTTMEEWSMKQNIHLEPSQVNCTRDGQCQEFRPCHVPCLKAMKHHSKIDGNKSMVNGSIQNTPQSDQRGSLNCNGGAWSACDYNCRQTKITATQDDTMNACVETSRRTRDCHIDACGRSDPCTIPYLVQATLFVEASDVQLLEQEWTPAFIEKFQKEFTRVAHLPELRKQSHQIFNEGDINILAITPRYDDDDLDEYGYRRLKENEEMDGNENDLQEPIGLDIILQVSIFNKIALASPTIGSKHRALLQEVGALWSNFTFRNDNPPSNCKTSDTYPLAKDALELSNHILKSKHFGLRIAEAMSAYRTVKVVSSWTINTQVYDDRINYYGPMGYRWGPIFIVLRFVFELCYIIALALAGLTVCSYVKDIIFNHYRTGHLQAVLQGFVIRVCRLTGRKWPRYQYDDQDDFGRNNTTSDVELSVSLSCTDYKKKASATTPKRRNLGIDP